MTDTGNENAPEDEPSEGLVLCSNCLHHNIPNAHFCEQCGMPLSTYSVIAPFERILSYGWFLRKATTMTPTKITLVGMWMLCAPTAVICFAFVIGFIRGDFGFPLWSRCVVAIPSAIGTLVFSAMLYMVTRNYLRLHPSRDQDDRFRDNTP